MKIKAAVGYAPGKPLEIHTVDLDMPSAGEVLVEIKASGKRRGGESDIVRPCCR